MRCRGALGAPKAELDWSASVSDMRFSFWSGNAHSWDEIVEACQHAEATGWDGIWLADHFMPFTGADDGPYHEAWTMLAGLAVAVPRIRIGPLVTGNTYRNPGVLAKMAATVDHMSGGRCVLGLGSGWQENEHTAYGIEYLTAGARLDKLEESVEIVRSLLSQERTSYDGEHYKFENAPLAPKPVQSPLPIMIGGGGEKRTLRITAKLADEWNVWGTPEVLEHKNAVLNAHCADVGRDPADIQRSAVALLFLGTPAPTEGALAGRPSVSGTVEQAIDTIGQYRDAGVDEFIVPDFTLGPLDPRKDTMDVFINEVASQFRD